MSTEDVTQLSDPEPEEGVDEPEPEPEPEPEVETRGGESPTELLRRHMAIH